MDLSSRIKELRREQNLTREQLAHEAHIPYSAVIRLEQGYMPKADRLAAVARVLGVTTSELLEEEVAS